MSGGGLHRPDEGDFGGDEAQTMVAEEGPVTTPASTTIYRSALNAPSRVGLGPGIAAAVGLHVAVVFFAFIVPRYFEKPVQHRAVIMARLMPLGKPRAPNLLPRAPSAPPAAAAAPAPAAPSLTKVAPKLQSKPAATPKPSHAASNGKRAPTNQELMERALAKAADQAVVEEPDPERAGAANGSATGTATSAEVGDKYFTEVHDAIAANYTVPSVISERERLYLSATVIAYIGPTGALLRHTLQKKSGNHFFDEALELAIKNSKLPAPPPELVKSLRDEGVALNFKP